MLRSLLDDIFREGAGLSLRVRVYDDGTTKGQRIIDNRAMFIYRTRNGGKKLFYAWINQIFRDARLNPWWGRLLLLPDDVRLVPGFFDELEKAWIRIPRGKRGILLNPLICEKAFRPNWTGIHAEYYPKADLYQVGWNDCCFYCDRRFIAKYKGVGRPLSRRWRKQYISSGVGDHISRWAVRNRWSFWQVPKSLLWSTPHPSQMHRKP